MNYAGLKNQSERVQLSGILFDVYHFEDEVCLWIRDSYGRAHLLKDRYYPVFYATGKESTLQKLIHRLVELNALAHEVEFEERLLFYENKPVQALKLTVNRPGVLAKIRRKLYAFYGRADLYHTDIEIPTGYMYERGIFPLAPVEVTFNKQSRYIESIHTTQSVFDLDYSLPRLRILRTNFEHSPRIPINQNRILFSIEDMPLVSVSAKNPADVISALNEILVSYDPDIILTTAGDQVLMPYLFEISQNQKIPLLLDRDPHAVKRKVTRQGSSYNTYGSWIYRAPSYPLFGRWHIDSANSFVYKESKLAGILELARLSRMPVQKVARASTGGALTCIETDVAMKKNYLVPWQKSRVENPKTAYELLRYDKGGLVFVPEQAAGYENVAQIDFSQMYPTIMDIHNISPETINCDCCFDLPGHTVPRVPETGYRICEKRRGVVSDSLRHILERRAYYKNIIKKLKAKSPQDSKTEKRIQYYDARQDALKWMLVTSFGYLGYRNAKFGKLESHEAVTAFGREKLLSAKEIAENHGFVVLHAITDCLFIQNTDATPVDPDRLLTCNRAISKHCGIEMSLEGIYSWLYFLESKVTPGLAVINRYFGRFTDGQMKLRGISVRRSDTCDFIRKAQTEWIEILSHATCLKEIEQAEFCQGEEGPLVQSYRRFETELLERRVPATDLLLRRKATKSYEDYTANGPGPSAMAELLEIGVEIQPGERIRYLVTNQKASRPEDRYISEERLTLEKKNQALYDTNYYLKQLQNAYLEIRPQTKLFEIQPDLFSSFYTLEP